MVAGLSGCAVNPQGGVDLMSKDQTTDFAKQKAEQTKETFTATYNKLFGKTREQQIESVAKKTGETIEAITAADAACPEGQKIGTRNEGSLFNADHVAVCVDGQHYVAPKP